jgi:hypothetical protein
MEPRSSCRPRKVLYSIRGPARISNGITIRRDSPMNCSLHPATPATATCRSCGRGLCSSCSARFVQPSCHHCVAQENATVARSAYRTLALSVIFFLVGFCLAGVRTPVATSASRAPIRIPEEKPQSNPSTRRPTPSNPSAKHHWPATGIHLFGVQIPFSLRPHSLYCPTRDSRLLALVLRAQTVARLARRGFPYRVDCRALSTFQIASPDPNRATHQTRTCNFLITI